MPCLVQSNVSKNRSGYPWVWRFRLFDPCCTLQKCRNCGLMLFVYWLVCRNSLILAYVYLRFIKVNFLFTNGEGKRWKLSFPSTVDNFRDTFRSPRYSFIASYDAKNELKKLCFPWRLVVVWIVMQRFFPFYSSLAQGVILRVWALDRVSVFVWFIGSGFKTLRGTHLSGLYGSTPTPRVYTTRSRSWTRILPRTKPDSSRVEDWTSDLQISNPAP